ncbi:MAG: HAD family phosphatase [Anaerolineales bacterium]|nr:HAD family phosphatase [Anaerolineales bacterium]
MPLRAVIFDIGGVLVRTADLEPRRKWERRLGLPDWGLARLVFENPAAAESTVGRASPEAVWAQAAERLALTPAELAELQVDFWRGDVWDEALLAYIRSLRPRYKTGIISNAWVGMRAMHQPRLNESTFDLIVYSAEEGLAKPDPALYQRTLARLGVAPAEAVFVDDVPENVAAARALGMAGVHFQPGVDVPAEFAALGIR